MNSSVYAPHSMVATTSAGLGIGQVTASWQQPSSNPYGTADFGGVSRAWDTSGYVGAPATGLPGTTPSYPYQQRIPSLTGPSPLMTANEARFVPLHDYDHHASHTTST